MSAMKQTSPYLMNFSTPKNKDTFERVTIWENLILLLHD